MLIKIQTPGKELDERKIMRNVFLIALIIMLITSQSIEAAEKDDILASALFPGAGQIRSRRFGRGSLFVSLEVVSLVSLLMTDIEYNRAVEQYENARTEYLDATYIGDALSSYNEMNKKWDDAENLDKYRKILVGTAVCVWAVSMADIIWGRDVDQPAISLQLKKDGFIVSREISF